MWHLCRYWAGRSFAFLSLFLLFCLLSTVVVFSQPPNNNYLSQFDTAFTTLAQQQRVTIVCEDSPQHLTLTPQQFQNLQKELQSAEPEKHLSLIAIAYDYEAKKRGNVVTLQKRFSDINDLPFVTFEETLTACKNIEHRLKRFDPPGRSLMYSDSVLMQFTKSLTDQQVNRVQQQTPVSSLLSPEQRQLLRQVCAKVLMIPYTQLERTYTWYFKRLSDPATQFQWIYVVPKTPQILILDGPLGSNGLRVQKALSHGFVFTSGGASSLRNPAAKVGIGSSLFIYDWTEQDVKDWQDCLTDLPDITAPKPGSTLPPRSSQSQTLSQIADRLNQRASGQRVYAVDSELASKPVCLFGEENTMPEQIAEAVAHVYSLAVARTETETKITIPEPPRLRGYEDVQKTLRTYFPAPYLRYYRAQFLKRVEFLKRPENLSESLKRVPGLAEHTFHYTHPARRQLEEEMYQTVVYHLRVALEPKIKNASDGKVAFRDAGVDVQRLFTLLCLMESLPQLEESSAQAALPYGAADPDFPNWLERLDNLVIEATVSPDRLRVVLNIWDATGERRHMIISR
jgi:hypothetical protein